MGRMQPMAERLRGVEILKILKCGKTNLPMAERLPARVL
jgi:hypothetical protein